MPSMICLARTRTLMFRVWEFRVRNANARCRSIRWRSIRMPVTAILGWTSVRMLETYSHSLPAAEQAAMDVLGRAGK